MIGSSGRLEIARSVGMHSERLGLGEGGQIRVRCGSADRNGSGLAHIASLANARSAVVDPVALS